MKRVIAALGVGVFLACAASGFAQSVEPNAGKWKTWIIASGSDFRVPPPPDATATQAELAWVRNVAVTTTVPGVVSSVTFWSSGAPSYRWIELLNDRANRGAPLTAFQHRVYTYVALAMYDATIAAWDSKYAYNRARPGAMDPTLKTRLPTPQSPSYPSEHAATAAAAAAVLSYFFPTEAADFQSAAEEAGKSQVYAGLNYYSDYTAGMDLGQKVAQKVIDRAKADGSDAVWTGSVPTGKCNWVGVNPANVTAPGFRPFLLTSSSEFRSAPPAACDSDQMVAEVATVRNTPRAPAAFSTNLKAMDWQGPYGLYTWPFVYASKWMFEDKLDQNAPRAARAYALLATAHFDAFIASHDSKYTYWYIRPSQLDPSIGPIFPVPNHPSYPSNHAVFSADRADLLAYLFPKHADEIQLVGQEAGQSRIWAGIHYPSDLAAGYTMGHAIAQKYIDWANSDGSQ